MFVLLKKSPVELSLYFQLDKSAGLRGKCCSQPAGSRRNDLGQLVARPDAPSGRCISTYAPTGILPNDRTWSSGGGFCCLSKVFEAPQETGSRGV